MFTILKFKEKRKGRRLCGAGTDWYEWDKEFIWKEQVTVVAPGVYQRFSDTTALSFMTIL